MMMPFKRMRGRTCCFALRAMVYSSLPFSASAPATPTPPEAPLAPLPLSTAKLFDLDEMQALPQRPFIMNEVDRAGAAPVTIAPADEQDGSLLDRLLTIREDLHFLINHSIQGLSNERITVGLNFARAF